MAERIERHLGPAWLGLSPTVGRSWLLVECNVQGLKGEDILESINHMQYLICTGKKIEFM